MSCDLHTHSTFSDGTSTPEELVSAAQELGLTAVALCDHNDVDGLPRFLAAARGGRTAAVPGTEISTVFEGTELHILGLFIPERGWEAVRELTARMRRSKEESNLTLERRLRAAGFAVDYAVTVSYTHLDVYKRQGRAQRARRRQAQCHGRRARRPARPEGCTSAPRAAASRAAL